MRMRVVVTAVFLTLLGPGCNPDFSELREAFLHPTGPTPECKTYSWIVTAIRCQDLVERLCPQSRQCVDCAGVTNLTLKPDASPPQAQMKEGEIGLVELLPINPDGSCNFNTGQSFRFVSSRPAIASLEPTGFNTEVFVRATRPGDVDIFADGVSTPSGPIRAPLAYCPSNRQGASCAPTNLILRVER
jgi:hypothetical protein